MQKTRFEGTENHEPGVPAIAGPNDAPFFTLQWADPLQTADDDYDLFLLDPTLTTVLDASTDVQDGDDRPFEDIDSDGMDDTGNRLVVVTLPTYGAMAIFTS